MNEINGVKVPFIPIVGNDEIFTPPTGKSQESFDSIFSGELDKLSFSGHAMKRLESRDIKLDDSTIGALQNAVDKAEAKGSKDSLVMMNDMAFIVNVPNRTVVTAMKINEKPGAVFTNIDSVVFA
jgi:flagellar operon protein